MAPPFLCLVGAGCMLVDGDMMLPIKPARTKRAIANNLWPNGVITYSLNLAETAYHNNPSMQAPQVVGSWDNAKQRIENAMATFTMLEFIPTDLNDADVAFTAYTTGCWAHVGKNNYQTQINLAVNSSFCWTHGTIVHELGHAAGLFHEQSRTDSDNYLHFLNGRNRNSQIENVNSRGLPYDFKSVMHYTLGQMNAQLTNLGQTRLAEQGISDSNDIGFYNELSDLDKQGLELMYPSPSPSPSPANSPGPSPSPPVTSVSFGTGGGGGSSSNAGFPAWAWALVAVGVAAGIGSILLCNISLPRRRKKYAAVPIQYEF